jgi:acyl phosphate:glycerol-3-phosphate acyltransferase
LATAQIIVYIIFAALYFGAIYLIGSIPTGYWLAKKLTGKDIRQMGSGSTGATNVYRCIGRTAGIAVFIIDFLKGYLPVVFIGFLFSQPAGIFHPPALSATIINLFSVLTAIIVLIGHSRSIFLNFKGGKSAATGLGTLFALDYRVGLFTFLTWFVVLYLGKMVSLASILATASCIPYMILFGGAPSYVAYCIIGFIFVAFRHKDNIKRMLSGKEPRIDQIGQTKI